MLRYIRLGVIILAVLILGGYGGWRSYDYTRGPDLVISSPADGARITEKTVVITGRAMRVNDLQMNGHPITLDEEGFFEQTIIIFPGINLITFKASDKFDRSVESSLTLLGSI